MAESKSEKELLGWTEGAEMLEIGREKPMIRVIAEAAYSQVFSKRTARQLRMTLLIPATGTPKAAVLFFPGGGWLEAAKDRFAEVRWALARAGFVVAAAEYRTIPCRFPAQMVDAKAAVRFLRANASAFEIDPDRIGVLGNSAGGWLAEMTALSSGKSEWDSPEWPGVPSSVSCCCALHPVSSLRGIAEGLSRDARDAHATEAAPEALLANGVAFTAPPKGLKEQLLQGSPIELLKDLKKKDIPPFLLVHGSSDRMVSPLQSAKMFRALLEKDADARYVLLPGADHSSDTVWYQDSLNELIVSFFRKNLEA